jgi:uncharacterized membrane protein YfcA
MLFGFAALQAVILDKALSLVVVLTALPARLATVPLSDLTPHWTAVANLLLGSLAGGWAGASWATRMRSSTLYRVLAVLLVLIAAALIGNHAGILHHVTSPRPPSWPPACSPGSSSASSPPSWEWPAASCSSPRSCCCSARIKIAGSLSLAVSLPTMLVAFARYRRDGSFTVLRRHARLTGVLAVGSITGTIAGGFLLGVVPEAVLVPGLAVLLILSSIKVWRHATTE